MKFSLLILFFASLFSFVPCKVKSQDTIPVTPERISTGISFPPLSVLIDSAIAHNAMLGYYEEGIMVKKYSLAAESKYWTKNFGIQADVRYGTFDNFSTNTAEGQNPSLVATRTNQTNYGVGAFLKLPLSDFFTHKSKMKLAGSEVEQAESMAEVQRNAIRQLVIEHYNNLLLKQTLLKIKAKNFENSKMNMMMAEKEFQNGVIPLGTYSNMSAVDGNAEITYEEAKTEYKTALMVLEEIVGFKFSIKAK
jgi:outer membrane protein TolC